MRGDLDMGRARIARTMRRQAEVQVDRIRALERRIVELEAQVGELEVFRGMAYLDHLTGLRNRRYFEERLHEELSRSNRTGSPCSLIVADVDELKRINDTQGHARGDDALRSVGRLLSSSQRLTDIACRIGGDEFAIILPDTGVEGARTLIERLEAEQRSLLGGLSVSFGAATYPGEGDKEGLLEIADQRMYAQKRAGKDGPPEPSATAA
jgi:diguanylate cyclase (GGDEF)-like protein